MAKIIISEFESLRVLYITAQTKLENLQYRFDGVTNKKTKLLAFSGTSIMAVKVLEDTRKYFAEDSQICIGFVKIVFAKDCCIITVRM